MIKLVKQIKMHRKVRIMKKVGVFLSRMQPIHNAHLWMIENALKENDEVLVIIGSADKCGNERNPFHIELRKEIVDKAISEYFRDKIFVKDRIKIITLVDWSSEENNDDKEWGRLIYYNVVGNMGVKEFSYYCSEEPKKIKGWFEDELIERINFRFFSRDNEFNGLSATKIREAILNENDEYVKKYCPKEVVNRMPDLERLIKYSIRNVIKLLHNLSRYDIIYTSLRDRLKKNPERF